MTAQTSASVLSRRVAFSRGAVPARSPQSRLQGLLAMFGAWALLVMFAGAGTARAQDFSAVDAARDQRNYAQEMALIERLRPGNEGNAEWLWRRARAEFDVSDQLPESSAQRKRGMFTALEYARKALAADERNAGAHSWYAATIGMCSLFEGADAQIKRSYDVQKHALRAIALDPSDANNYHMLGRWHYQLADLSWAERTLATVIYSAPPKASFEESIRFYAKARDLEPDAVRHNLWLGKSLLKVGRKGDARAALSRSVQLPPRDESDRRDQKEARELLRQM